MSKVLGSTACMGYHPYGTRAQLTYWVDGIFLLLDNKICSLSFLVREGHLDASLYYTIDSKGEISKSFGFSIISFDMQYEGLGTKFISFYKVLCNDS